MGHKENKRKGVKKRKKPARIAPRLYVCGGAASGPEIKNCTPSTAHVNVAGTRPSRATAALPLLPPPVVVVVLAVMMVPLVFATQPERLWCDVGRGGRSLPLAPALFGGLVDFDARGGTDSAAEGRCEEDVEEEEATRCGGGGGGGGAGK